MKLESLVMFRECANFCNFFCWLNTGKLVVLGFGSSVSGIVHHNYVWVFIVIEYSVCMWNVSIGKYAKCRNVLSVCVCKAELRRSISYINEFNLNELRVHYSKFVSRWQRGCIDFSFLFLVRVCGMISFPSVFTINLINTKKETRGKTYVGIGIHYILSTFHAYVILY